MKKEFEYIVLGLGGIGSGALYWLARQEGLPRPSRRQRQRQRQQSNKKRPASHQESKALKC